MAPIVKKQPKTRNTKMWEKLQFGIKKYISLGTAHLPILSLH